jgi:hypothetical protein
MSHLKRAVGQETKKRIQQWMIGGENIRFWKLE